MAESAKPIAQANGNLAWIVNAGARVGTDQAGAATSIYLASSPDVQGVTGRYFAGRKPKTSSKASYDEAAAARLWEVSAALVGMTTSAR